MLPPPPTSTLFPYTTLFRSPETEALLQKLAPDGVVIIAYGQIIPAKLLPDRKSTRLNSSHVAISYAVFCLKKKNKKKKDNRFKNKLIVQEYFDMMISRCDVI